MINERLFGSPISGQVRKKLEDRQRVAGEVAFGDSIEAVYPDKDGQNQADLSSRTPFIRMWTSVKLVQPAQVAEMLEKIEIGEIYYTGFNGTGLSDDALDRLAIRKAQKRINTRNSAKTQERISRLSAERQEAFNAKTREFEQQLNTAKNQRDNNRADRDRGRNDRDQESRSPGSTGPGGSDAMGSF